jgi:hypothetical protein
MKTYTIALHGFWKFQANIFEENNNLVAKSELGRRKVQVEFLDSHLRRVLTRHGFFHQWYQLTDENGNVICYSNPKMTRYPLQFFTEPNKEFLRIERSIFHLNYVFLNARYEAIAWMKKKGTFSRKYELKMESTQPLISDIVSIAVGMLLFDAADAVVVSAAVASSTAAASAAASRVY